jgi:acetoin utilization deacetylase AcuC-like enzyme
MPLPIVHHPSYTVPLPHRHRFPMNKYQALIEALREEGLARAENIHAPEPAPRWWLELAHDTLYVADMLAGTAGDEVMRRIGLPWTPALIERARMAVGGTVLAARLALQRGLACQTAGGSHHAGTEAGAGYCIFNDVAVAARALQAMNLALTMVVIDLDVHQGDGTAEIFHGDDAVFTFSMHCEKNFPVRKQTSDRDVALPVGLGDGDYLEILQRELAALFADRRPDLVFYNAGVDPHRADRLGKLELSDDGLARRDAMVIGACMKRGIPLACVIGGGYDNDIAALGKRHATLHRQADRCYEQVAKGRKK